MKVVIGKKITEQGKTELRHATVIDMVHPESAADLSAMTELKDRRGVRSKYYTDSRGKMMAEFFDRPVHYYDAEEGMYKEVDARFNDNGDILETRSNAFKSRFQKHVRDGKIFEMEKDLCKVELKSLDASKCDGCDLHVCECDDGDCNCSKVLVKNVTANSDIEYTVDSERIKENIIIKERADKYEYDFDLSLDNLIVDISADGKNLELLKKDSGRLEFYIPAPVMYDANGEQSEDVYFEVEQDSTENIKIKVIADSKWINSTERIFPVKIDPQIVAAQVYGEYYASDNYSSSIFRYDVIEGGKTIGGDPRIFHNSNRDIYTQLTILRNRLPKYIQENFKSIRLKLRAKPGSVVNGFSVGTSTFFENEKLEFETDITSYFWNEDEEIVLGLSSTTYRGATYDNDITFYPPTLLVEYENRIESLSVKKAPTKTEYIPGEKFDPAGMQVVAKHEDGSVQPVAIEELDFEPKGTLATYDTAIKITHRDEQVYCQYSGIVINKGKYWLNDRRAAEGKEGVYEAIPVNKDGSPTGEDSQIIRLQLADGVEADNDCAGTPLNAETFNQIIKVLKDKGILD